MRLALVIFLILFQFGCAKEEIEIQKNSDFVKEISGTYVGKRFINYGDYVQIDTITLRLDSAQYNYFGSYIIDYGIYLMDNGGGSYTLKDDTLFFQDEFARDCFHSWDHILSGKFKVSFKGDSLLMQQREYRYREITYRLAEVIRLN